MRELCSLHLHGMCVSKIAYQKSHDYPKGKTHEALSQTLSNYSFAQLRSTCVRLRTIREQAGLLVGCVERHRKGNSRHGLLTGTQLTGLSMLHIIRSCWLATHCLFFLVYLLFTPRFLTAQAYLWVVSVPYTF